MLVSTNNTVKTKIVDFDITKSKIKKLLGVKFDQNFSFDDHISELCKKGSRKIHELSRVTPYMKISKRLIFMNAVPLYECVIVVLTIAK